MKLREMFWKPKVVVVAVEGPASEKDPRRFCPRLWRLRKKTAVPQLASDVGSPEYRYNITKCTLF